jgi:maleylpyruvate isomerase
MAEVDRATVRLLDNAIRISDRDVGGPSLLPGWTRGHVLAHLARNADGLTNLLTWARTGVVTPQYVSWEQREADIEAGADRSGAGHLADLRLATARFSEAAAAMSPDAWATMIGSGTPQPAAHVAWRRLREVEVHHVDLDVDYRPEHWPDAFSHRLLHEACAHFRDRADAPALVLRATELGHDMTIGDPASAPTVTGPAYALAGWLTGRTRGDGLDVRPAGALPPLPDWI